QEEKENKYLLMVDMHHIISDGMSTELLVQDFMALYREEELAVMRLQYRDFSEWQNNKTQREAQIKQKNYWTEQLEGEIPVLDLPGDYIRPTVQRFEGSTVTFTIEQEEVKALGSLALAEGVTLYMILLGIYYILLSKLSNQEDILVGTPTAGRGHADLQQIIGMFVNTLVLRNYPSGDKTYRRFLKEIKTRTLQAFENQDYPYEELVEEVVIIRDASRNPLFDTMFVLQNMEIPGIEIPELELTPIAHRMERSKFDLTLMGMEEEERLFLTFEYSTNLFKKSTIERFVSYIKKVVCDVVDNPDIKICEVEIVGEEEKREILYNFNDTAVKYPKDKTIDRLFEEQTQKTPAHIALIFSDKELTYRELNKRAVQLSHRLQSKRMQANAIVGLMVERSIEMIIGILAILKCGDAYLPIDPDYPGDRIEFMLSDSGSERLLISQDLSKKINFEKEIIYLSDTTNHISLPRHLPPSPALSRDLAYVIYTSGSTGTPKGVLVEHSSVINLALSQKGQFNINEKERILQFSTICFDASVEQIFIALFSGAVLVLIDKGLLLEARQFEAFIASRCITHLHAVPSFLDNMGLENIYHLKRIISGGDVCPVSLARKWNKCCDFYNEYGPTETTVTSLEMLVEEIDEGLARLPVGRPINNTIVYLFDQWIKPVGLGVVGELYLGGEGVARGYLNRPELTAEKFVLAHGSWFIANRMEKKVSSPGELPMSYQLSAMSYLYKTGDLARWLADGNIEFLGRIDQQLKIRGFRIEPGEIENQLMKYDGIREAVVLAVENGDGEKYLAAYMVSKDEISLPGLRGYLLSALPDYMLPSCFISLEELPLTPTGKIDRKLLPAPEIKSEEEYLAPRDEMERRLAQIWGEVLQLSVPIGIDDHFFQLGGHSLKAVTLLSKIHQAFAVKMPLAEVFKSPSIRGLSGYIRTAVAEQHFTIAAAEEKAYYALSSAQKRLYFLQQMEENEIAYNMPSLWLLSGNGDKARMAETFRKLIQRHESLRTSFERLVEEPVQRIHDQVEFEI
ncbi:MAG: amino acid adenylation domain-containing protein, partial [Candidatus Aminicenantes bacterium]